MAYIERKKISFFKEMVFGIPIMAFYIMSLSFFNNGRTFLDTILSNTVALLLVIIDSVLVKNGVYENHTSQFIKKYKHKYSIYLFLISIVGFAGMIGIYNYYPTANKWLFFLFHSLFALGFIILRANEQKVEGVYDPPKYDLPSLRSD